MKQSQQIEDLKHQKHHDKPINFSVDSAAQALSNDVQHSLGISFRPTSASDQSVVKKDKSIVVKSVEAVKKDAAVMYVIMIANFVVIEKFTLLYGAALRH
jgi:hypothetical protein